jgi:hypothetical protein
MEYEYFLIEKRDLNNQEIDLLISDVLKVPQLIAGNRKRWQKFELYYILKDSNLLIGVCAVIRLKNWIKLGPFAI